MTLPRFFSRISDSIGPLMVKGNGSDLREFLTTKSVLLVGGTELDRQPLHLAGFLLLVNLCARLYPRIAIKAPSSVYDECRKIVLQINPGCDIVRGDEKIDADGTVAWACDEKHGNAVCIAPAGWKVLIDTPDARENAPTNMLTALAAGAIAASELFRSVFSEFLGSGRAKNQKREGSFSLLDISTADDASPQLPSDIALGRVHLVGAGAIGQAAIYALSRVSVTGTIVVIDAENVALSNLQRYVLTNDRDVGTSKTDIVARALSNTRVDVIKVPSEWSADLPETQNAEVICAAVDSEIVRIALQASLPRRLYNAWTQPADIGWSRHESFGSEPCAACLYWPTAIRPSYHELVARALRQHELRILTYLTQSIPIDLPLHAARVPQLPQYGAPVEIEEWSRRSLLQDVMESFEISAADAVVWKGRQLSELYREGICAGALVHKQHAEIPAEMAVPLAHQSALAGILLAMQLITATRPELRMARNASIESRLDLMKGWPQVSSRPRVKTPSCLCADPDFVAFYERKWPYRGW